VLTNSENDTSIINLCDLSHNLLQEVSELRCTKYQLMGGIHNLYCNFERNSSLVVGFCTKYNEQVDS